MIRLVEKIDRELDTLRVTQSLGPETFNLLRQAASHKEADTKRIAELEGALSNAQAALVVAGVAHACKECAAAGERAGRALSPKAKDGSR